MNRKTLPKLITGLAVLLICSGYFLYRLNTEETVRTGRDAAMFGTAADSTRHVHIRTDFASFYYAAKASALGKDMYSARTLDSLAAVDGVANHVLPYLYPPFLAIVSRPLANLEPQTAQYVWDVAQVITISLVCAMLAITLPFRSAEIAGRRFWIVGGMTACFAAAILPFWENILFGQVNTLVVLLVVGSFFSSINLKRDWVAGIMLAAAALIKVTPALLLLPFFINRRLRVMGGFLAGLFLLILVTIDVAGKEPWREFFAFLPNMGYARNVEGGFHPSIVANFSIAGFLMRLIPGEAPTIRLVAMIAAIALVALTLFHHAKKRSERSELSFLLPYFILMVVTSPVAWRHHIIYIAPGVVFLLRELWFEARPLRRVFGVLLVASFTGLASLDFQSVYPSFAMSESLRPVLTAMNLWFLLALYAASLFLPKRHDVGSHAVQPFSA